VLGPLFILKKAIKIGSMKNRIKIMMLMPFRIAAKTSYLSAEKRSIHSLTITNSRS